MKIAIGFVLSFIIGAGCRYFDIPAASPPVIPGALIVLAMTLGYTSMDRVLIRKDRSYDQAPVRRTDWSPHEHGQFDAAIPARRPARSNDRPMTKSALEIRI